MSKNKNALPGAGTPDRADGAGPASQAGDQLQDEYTTLPACWQDGIVSGLLSIGQENAVPLRHLKAMLTGWSGREIRREIERERRAGIPILSDNIGGYFLPATNAELSAFVSGMKRRALEIEYTAEAVAKASKMH